MSFSWSSIIKGTALKRSDILELKTNIDHLEAHVSSSYSWSEIPPTVGTNYQNADMQELRSALDDAYDKNVCSAENVTYDSTILTGQDISIQATQNSAALVSQDSAADSTQNSAALSSQDSAADSTKNNTVLSGQDVTADSTQNNSALTGQDSAADGTQNNSALSSQDTSVQSTQYSSALGSQDTVYNSSRDVVRNVNAYQDCPSQM